MQEDQTDSNLINLGTVKSQVAFVGGRDKKEAEKSHDPVATPTTVTSVAYKLQHYLFSTLHNPRILLNIFQMLAL